MTYKGIRQMPYFKSYIWITLISALLIYIQETQTNFNFNLLKLTLKTIPLTAKLF